jgi:hypothetical protein
MNIAFVKRLNMKGFECWEIDNPFCGCPNENPQGKPSYPLENCPIAKLTKYSNSWQWETAKYRILIKSEKFEKLPLTTSVNFTGTTPSRNGGIYEPTWLLFGVIKNVLTPIFSSICFDQIRLNAYKTKNYMLLSAVSSSWLNIQSLLTKWLMFPGSRTSLAYVENFAWQLWDKAFKNLWRLISCCVRKFGLAKLIRV